MRYGEKNSLNLLIRVRMYLVHFRSFHLEKIDSRIVQSLFITSLRYLKYPGNVPEIKLVMVSPRSG